MFAAPTLLAAVLAAVYVLVSPPSLDLAAALFRTRLFEVEGFGIWDDFWYSGHALPGYSVLFPALGAALTPQLAGALAAVASVPSFTVLARRHAGRGALPGALLFGAFTAVDLFTGRLPFALATLPMSLAVLALDGDWWPAACLAAALTGLCDPVAALFTAIIAAGYGIGALSRQRRVASALPGTATGLAALLPVLVVEVAFPAGGSEPFALGSMAPVLAVTVLGLVVVEKRRATLRACLAVYGLAVLVSFLVPSAVGSNAARLGTLLAAPVATVVLWERRPRLLAAAIVPLLYIGLQAPVQNLAVSSGQPSTSVAFYRPLLRYLAHRAGPPFRIEIPFTALHWEAYRVATHIPIARGWERQLDGADNPIFYRRGALTAASYRRWLSANAVRFVALPGGTSLDSSARREAALVRGGLPYLGAPVRTGAWSVYPVRAATPIVQGPATLTGYGPDWLRLRVTRPGRLLVHVRFTSYWALTAGAGCVSRAGAWTEITARRPGVARLGIRFALGRIGAHGPRCST